MLAGQVENCNTRAYIDVYMYGGLEHTTLERPDRALPSRPDTPALIGLRHSRHILDNLAHVVPSTEGITAGMTRLPVQPPRPKLTPNPPPLPFNAAMASGDAAESDDESVVTEDGASTPTAAAAAAAAADAPPLGAGPADTLAPPGALTDPELSAAPTPDPESVTDSRRARAAGADGGSGTPSKRHRRGHEGADADLVAAASPSTAPDGHDSPMQL